MSKLILYAPIILFSGSILADANIGTQNKANTFLLEAPGTLSQAVKGQKNPLVPKKRTAGKNVEPRQYKYVGDDYFKFRQYGQQRGQNNPWTDDRYQTSPPTDSSWGMRQENYSNPWHLDGAHPPGLEKYQSRSFPFVPPSDMMAPGIYGGMRDFHSDFTDGIYRDTNPAAIGPGFNSFFMPGMGGDDLSFPFLPF